MIQFEYDNTMKRYNVKVPFTLADEDGMALVASISEDEESKLTLHRQLPMKLVQQILVTWDEYEHQLQQKILNELDLTGK